MINLINGDCLVEMKKIGDKSVDLILTDPPYGMNYQSSRRTATEKFRKIENDNVLGWVCSFMTECFRVLKDDRHTYIFCNDYAISLFRDYMKEVGFNPKRTLVWVKNNHTSGDLLGDYGNKTEFIVYAQKGRRLLNGKRDTNVLSFNKVSNLSHPTQKPVDMNEYLVGKSSFDGEVVLDPFMGSGTTGVACKNLGRSFIGIEKDESYFNLAKQRIESHEPQMKLV